jgi:hypothetical protein
MAQFGVPPIERGWPIMQTVLDKPGADADDPVRVHAADEGRELALLAQFMRCDSVASLANAIAERLGDRVRGDDLIVAAGLGSSGGETCGSTGAVPVNPGAALRR